MNAIATLALLTPLALLPQDPQTAEQTLPEASIRTAAEMVMHQYTPQSISAHELYEYAALNLSHSFQVRDERTGSLSTHSSIQTLGGRLVIYENAPVAKRLLETLEALDLPSLDTRYATAVSQLRAEIYSPKHVSYKQLYLALEPFKKSVPYRLGASFRNVTAIDELGQLVIRDTPEKVKEMIDFLELTDQPSKQVLLTAYLVTPTADAKADSGLPSELVAGLAPMLGAKGLDRLALGVVRTSVGMDRQVLLTLQVRNAPFGILEFAPSAFNADSNGGGSLTLRSCTLTVQGSVAFSTQTSVNIGEYVVLGATGSDPAYLVLHIKAL